MEIKTIGFASDHAGFALKNTLLNYMVAKGYVCHDFGTYSEESCDYPDYAHLLARAVEPRPAWTYWATMIHTEV